MKKLLILFLTASTILFVFSGCRTPRIIPRNPPDSRKIPKEKIIEKNFDTTWSKLIDYFKTQNILIKNIDKATGILSTDYDLKAGGYNFKNEEYDNSHYCDCGKIGKDPYYAWIKYENYKGNINIFVNKINDNQTNIKINAFFKADYNFYEFKNHNYELVGTRKIDCESTGFVEKEIFDFLEQ